MRDVHGGVPGMFKEIQGCSWECLGSDQGMFKESSGIFLGMFMESLGDVQDSEGCSGNMNV